MQQQFISTSTTKPPERNFLRYFFTCIFICVSGYFFIKSLKPVFDEELAIFTFSSILAGLTLSLLLRPLCKCRTPLLDNASRRSLNILYFVATAVFCGMVLFDSLVTLNQFLGNGKIEKIEGVAMTRYVYIWRSRSLNSSDRYRKENYIATPLGTITITDKQVIDNLEPYVYKKMNVTLTTKQGLFYKYVIAIHTNDRDFSF